MMNVIRIILVLTALTVPGAASPSMAGEPAGESGGEIFLLGATDIPLMPGLTGNEAATVFFDKPAGRIMIARPDGCVDPKEASRFYAATLPQLGWLPAEGVSSLIYLREGERLTLEFADDMAREGECAALRFLLSPVPGAQ